MACARRGNRRPASRSRGTACAVRHGSLFRGAGLSDFAFHVKLCEDFWSAMPPSARGTLAGARILCNLSASNVVVAKADDRALLCASQSMRCHGAYVYSAAGQGESTTDLAWDGQASIHELGVLLAQTARFPSKGQMCIADVGGLERSIDRFPFVPDDAAKLDRDCYEAFNIQVQGLVRRMHSNRSERVVIGCQANSTPPMA
jgi:NAD+ synthase (glutamine-hydrolysing)